MENEIWKPVKIKRGKKNLTMYEVSSLGNVKSVSRVAKIKGHTITGAILKKHRISTGYVVVSLNGKTQRVSRLVCSAFHQNPERKPEVNHINGIKSDDRAVNLEWNTRLENQRHAMVNNLQKARITDEQTAFVRANYAELGSTKLADMFGFSKSYIVGVALGKHRKHLGGVRQTKSNWIGDAPKPIIEYDLNMNELNRYSSASRASKLNGLLLPRIREVLIGEKPTYKGKIYRYADPDMAKTLWKKKPKPVKVMQYDLSGKKIGDFIGITDAAKKIGISKYLIRDVITGRQKTTHGFVFKKA